MKTYNVYEVGYRGKMPDENLTSEEVFDIVMDNGDWDLVKMYNSKAEALRMWEEWAKNAYTEKDPYDDIIHYNIVMLEESEWNESVEIIKDCIMLDYIAEPFIRSEVREWDR